ncbi:MAG: hypothetical protein ABL973_17120 [Micropepsaceae bacterium]
MKERIHAKTPKKGKTQIGTISEAWSRFAQNFRRAKRAKNQFSLISPTPTGCSFAFFLFWRFRMNPFFC